MLARVMAQLRRHAERWRLYEFAWQKTGAHRPRPRSQGDQAALEATTHEAETDEKKYRKVQDYHAGEPDAEDRLVEVLARASTFADSSLVAAQAYLGDNDGFLGSQGMNNFICIARNQEVHVLIAWDTDNTFWDRCSRSGGRHQRPEQKLMRIPEFNALWFAEIQRANEMAEADGWLDAEITRNLQLIEDAMREDRYKPYSNTSFEGEAGQMLAFARERIAFVKCALAQGDRACGG